MEADDQLDDHNFVHFPADEHRLLLNGGRSHIPPGWSHIHDNSIRFSLLLVAIQARETEPRPF